MGSIHTYTTQSGKRYRVRYRTPDRRQTDKRGFRTKRDAEQFLASVEVAKGRGEWVDPTLSRVSVGAWSTTWLASRSNLKPTTRGAYEWILARYVLPQWRTVPLVAVTHVDVQVWVTGLSATLAPSTVRKIHVIFSGLMKYAVQDRRIPHNPCDNIRLPRVTADPRGYLTHEQVAELAELCGTDGTVIYLLAYTGLRWGELAALKVKRVDLHRRRLDVAEAVTEPTGAIIWGTPKNHERRSVPFPSFLTDLLVAQCAGKRADDLVFTSAAGGVLRGGNFRNRRFDAAVAVLRESYPELPKITPRSLRHTAASLAISAGATVLSVQRMLGHASAAMTLDVYSDLFDDDLDAVATALDDRARRSDVGKMWARAGESSESASSSGSETA
ncbi:tyrosine-type recombinase/integrase [Cryobacterium sp. RTS3]|uniref:tyrosine-type recombinase/integrase n=1 Tax=Cryobacterium sp. RTS3 TaxID=3048643 RepID=UPI002B237797|nr:tyrosine-type recombinase/integrase [Cryobacterium sp. RTS3]MEB0000590.1 tyrosine-type recombinase/integrase [Cryobacterium sp. RTS3]